MTLSIFFSAAALILWAFSFVFFLNYLKRRTSVERILKELQDEMDHIINEVNEATDRDLTLVEDRVKSLRALLEDADRRIAVYTRELDRRRTQDAAYAELGRHRPPAGTAAPASITAFPPALQAEASPAEASPESAPGPAGASPTAASTELAPPSGLHIVRSARPIEPKPLPFAERVAELHRAGFDAALIASRLGATLAEVDLAIALADRRGYDPDSPE
jgi:hypothetical protein